MKKLILLIVLFVLRSLCCFAENEGKIKFIVYQNNHYKYMVNEKILLFYGGLIINNDDRIFLFKEDHSDKSAPARDREFAMMESNDAPVLTFYPERGHYMLWSYGVEADSSDFTIPEIIGEVYLEENFINEILANNFYWYILRDIPYSSTSREEYCEECKRRLREYYLPSLNKSQLRILRNTIYAYYGYLFASKDLRVFFNNRMKWYKPVDDFDESLIAEPHREFINLIKEFESKL
ncbi:YARHG domain-containing protein [uncultured Treponema sp.]|uniref:YARHG domain-containing protein n=1 Tax=uncultured Treponema sp. TaxID=162155 RepID=UPI0025909741|nr:YARHG domain-containing protein [uncultured Treponema sp.]